MKTSKTPDRRVTSPFDQFEHEFATYKLALTRAMAWLWLAVRKGDEHEVAERREGVKTATQAMRAFCNRIELSMDTFEITFPPTENKPSSE